MNEPLPIKHIELRGRKIAAQTAISDEVLNAIPRYQLKEWRDTEYGRMVITVERMVHGHDHEPKNGYPTTVTHTFTETRPFFQTWWARSPRHLWTWMFRPPLRRRDRQVAVEKWTTVTPKWRPITAFPDLPFIPPPGWGRPIRMAVFDRWETDE